MKNFKKFILIFFLFLTGCLKTTTLKNGYQKASVNPKVFKNRIYFEKSIFSQIDTTVIYEQYDDNYYEGFVKQENTLARFNYKNLNTIYAVYRFYGNGNYSLFHLDRNNATLTGEMFNPDFTGWRGVLYVREHKILGDLVTQVGQMSWEIGIEKQEFTVKGDTLFIERKHTQRLVYVKRQVNPELLQQHADW